MPTGPATVNEGEFDSARPSGVQIAAAAVQSVVAASDTATSSNECGRTVMTQRWFWFDAARRAPVTRPFVARSASPSASCKADAPGSPR